MSYSGTTNFEFEIERYKDKDTGELRTYEQCSGDDFEDEYTIIALMVEGSSYFQQGKCFGPPENCYPDEGEIEIISIMGPDGKDWEDKLTEDERESILQQIDQNVLDDMEGNFEPDNYYDERD